MALCLCGLATSAVHAADDIVIADFEGPDYGPWKSTGEAFGPGPAHGTLPGQMRVDGFQGNGLVISFYKGDHSTGTLTSPGFAIQRKYISFLIGGGKDTGKTCMNLLIDGKAVRNATGPNDKPGGSEALLPEFWDVGEFAGRTAILQIVDQATGGWGHINVDQIVQTDRKPPGLVANATREFKIERRYLNLPIKNGTPRRVVTMLVDGRVEVRNDIELAGGVPDWWAPMDVRAWQGRTVTFQVDKLPEDSASLSSITQSDAIHDGENLYREPLRGQFHFSSRRGWNNDPNGLVYFNGEYHLFYQHNPYGWAWGNMHWGHAVSRDMVHWQELGDELLPDDLGPMFSGSAVVDWKNTSGLGGEGKLPLVLIYTAAGNPAVQCIAYSTDGRTFTKFAGNPVVKEISDGNRDPKVMWHQPSQKWVMALYVKLADRNTIHFLTSTNLKDWKVASHTDDFFECPDLFELPVDGDISKKKWVLTAADSRYMIGRFDGTNFTPESPKLPGHRGRGFYAAQTFSDIPAKDGRRIQIGWFQTETKGMPFNQSMTIPLELNLISTPDGPRLTMNPVKELAVLRVKSHRPGPLTLRPGDANPFASAGGELLEVRAEFEPGAASTVNFNVRGVPISYDVARQELAVNGHAAPAALRNGRQLVIIFADRTGLEVFASDGLTYVPVPVNLDGKNFALGIGVTGAPVKFASLEAYNLRSAWK